MTDPNFHKRSGAVSLAQIAAKSGSELANPADGDFLVEDVAPLNTAGPVDLSFLDNRKYRDQFSSTKCGACIIHPDMAKNAPPNVRLLLSKSPYKSYALAANTIYPNTKPPAGIAKTAVINDTAKIGQGTTIDHFVVIGENVQIGVDCWIGPHVTIGDNVKIGDGCRLYSNVSVTHALIGDRVWLHPGVRIGQDGFGFAIDQTGFTKVPQLGRVIIEGHSEIGANTTIDRGALGDTVIGMGSWLDNLIQVGHNTKIGKGCILVSHVAIAGSVEIGDYVMLGGQAGVAGHIKVGSRAKIAAKSGVTRDVPEGAEWMGYPAMPMKQYLRHTALLNRMTKNKPVSDSSEQ